MRKTALITGICGQDGSYLAELLLKKGYRVYGTYRWTSVPHETYFRNIQNIRSQLILYPVDLNDLNAISELILNNDFDEIYNLAALTDVATSFKSPVITLETNLKSVVCMMDCIMKKHRKTGFMSKFYQAGTSEMFGGSDSSLNEDSLFNPRSPYAVSKLAAYQMVKIYRESYGLYAVCGILFNHESKRRGDSFVTQKIVKAFQNIVDDLKNERTPRVCSLGNLDAKRDWGHSRDFVEAMYLMLQNNEPKDYVVGTGRAFSVREFAEQVAEVYGYSILWFGSGINEVGYILGTRYVAFNVNPQFYRPNEVNTLISNPENFSEFYTKKTGKKFGSNLSDIIKDMCD